MPVRLLPDCEALVRDLLTADATLTGLVAGRVSTELPASPTWPLITLMLVTGTEVVREHLDEQVVQLSAWGDGPSGKGTAATVIRTARAVVLAAAGMSVARGVITDSRTVQPPRWLPDPETDRPRYVCDMALRVHPHPL